MSSYALVGFFILICEASGFSSSQNVAFSRKSERTGPLYNAASPMERYFQLEEMEDKDLATTELFLNRDSTVTVGRTDGPIHIDASGTWKLNNRLFEMTLVRTYEGGKEARASTDLGEFSFAVDRTFTGQIGFVAGEIMSIEGVIHSFDEHLGDQEVGYFNMIDTTDGEYRGRK